MRKRYSPGLPEIEVPTEEQQAFHTTEKALMAFQSNGSPNAGAAASWKLLDMQILQPHLKPKASEFQMVDHSTQGLDNISKCLQ